MGVNVVVNESNGYEESLEYPVIMQSKISGIVVLFSGYKTGMVLKDSEHYRTGYYYGEWTPVDNSLTWKKFEGSITLSNQ